MKKSVFRRLLDMVFWRKGPPVKEIKDRPEVNRSHETSSRERPEQRQTVGACEEREKDWLYVGNDEEGTRIYLDRNRIVRPSGSIPARVWLKHVPPQGTCTFEQARQYLEETGADWKAFCYVEQLIEMDVNRNLIADLVLFFFDENNHLIEQVQFHERTHRPSGAEAVFSAIKETVAGHDTQPEPTSDQPSIDERIELKLQEISTVFEAFDRCDRTENANTTESSDPKTSH